MLRRIAALNGAPQAGEKIATLRSNVCGTAIGYAQIAGVLK